MSYVEQYSELWAVDFEFTCPDGAVPEVLCMSAVELLSGRRVNLWRDDLARLRAAPFATGRDSLVIAYFAAAEMQCFESLGWPLPDNVVDLYAEFRQRTNGGKVDHGRGLLGALMHYGLPAIGGDEKTEMRALAMRGGSYTAEERAALMAYCQSDVDALAALWAPMSAALDDRSLLRGRYMRAVGLMQHVGVPVDAGLYNRMVAAWPALQGALIDKYCGATGIYDGTTFKADRFRQYAERHGIAWPRLPSGTLALDEATFKGMAKTHPQSIGPIWQLRAALGQMRNPKLAVGPDGRNRCLLSPFASVTGRNQPSTTKFVFGLPSWLRALIRPEPGMALAYIDWAQQEFGVAAALSGDAAMMEAYLCGDPYLGFAIEAGAVPVGATKKSHPREREAFKTVVLGVQFSMGPETLAQRLSAPEAEARHLLALHRRTFPNYWRWIDAACDYAHLNGRIHASYGWQMCVTPDTRPRTIQNFPMQGNGSEMMRIAAIRATEAGVRICCPVHDAFLIEAPVAEIDHAIATTQAAMEQASRDVLGGFSLRSDAVKIVYPDRYVDGRGADMWATVMALLEQENP